ncbi:MAG: 1-deoxy-D-xylulose-5-phosphate synthase N-terminal domain-containing protein [Elusimicrobiota bacterium]|nr:1-deoxy-D-xylulose-5-phosphate synthase N-terminal domain-containing protein [Elusimicrobiota bacterium]
MAPKTFLINKRLFKKAFGNLPDKPSTGILARLAAVNRINALAAIKSAEHGWLGASFSCADIVTYLYFREMKARDILILSKGHAAPVQYAALAAKGVMDFEELLSYKTPRGLQAHTDMSTPGIVSNTGSLGQSLSKAAGMIMASRLKKEKKRAFVILGDGELQEGQNFEAMMNIRKNRLTELIPIIDRNNLQTDSAVSDIKGIDNLEKTLSGMGFKIISAKGNDMKSVEKAFAFAGGNKPCVIIADTVKGAGSPLTAMKNTARRKAVWHSKVPSSEEYAQILEGLVRDSGAGCIKDAFGRWRISAGEVAPAFQIPSSRAVSTRDAFAEELFSLMKKNKKIIVFDADLEKSMKLTPIAEKYSKRFVESGIAEQDMASTAGGFALEGFIPVVNTYASFFRRCFEQIYVNATEKKPVIYAGSYSGLCYASDGKTHQMTGDVPMMRSIHSVRVYDPFSASETKKILRYYLSGNKKIWNYPVYIKLRRSPPDFPFKGPRGAAPDCGTMLKKGKNVCVVVSGPHLASYALKAVADLSSSSAVAAFTAQNYLDHRKTVSLLRPFKKIIVMEEGVTSGGLADEISKHVLKAGLSTQVFRRGVDGFTFSARDKKKLFEKFSLDVKSIKKLLEKKGTSLK